MSGQQLEAVDLEQDWVEEEASSRWPRLWVVTQALPDEVSLEGVLQLVNGVLDSLFGHRHPGHAGLVLAEADGG